MRCLNSQAGNPAVACGVLASGGETHSPTDIDDRLAQLDAMLTRVINRRATVEQWMFDAARGKRPMPTPDELREWAIKLGTP